MALKQTVFIFISNITRYKQKVPLFHMDFSGKWVKNLPNLTFFAPEKWISGQGRFSKGSYPPRIFKM